MMQMDNHEDDIIIICQPEQKIIKAELKGAYNPNLELKTTFGYYTFDKEEQDVKKLKL